MPKKVEPAYERVADFGFTSNTLYVASFIFETEYAWAFIN